MKKIIRNFCYVLFLFAVLSAMGFGVSKSSATVLSDANMRFVRLHATLLDSMGHPYQSVGWNTKGDWKDLTKSQMMSGYLMFKYLLIPGAPWMQWQGQIRISIREEAQVETIGEESFHPLKIPGQKEMSLIMWKTTYTDGKWIGVGQDKIYACGEDGTGKQIGWLKYKSLTIETGETVLLFMTKGMEANAMWEGDVEDTAYREEKEGKGTPIGKLEFRPVKLEDGKETVILMFRPLSGDATWTGVRNGKIIKSK